MHSDDVFELTASSKSSLMRRVVVSTIAASIGIATFGVFIALDLAPIAVLVFALTFLFIVVHGVITWVLLVRGPKNSQSRADDV